MTYSDRGAIDTVWRENARSSWYGDEMQEVKYIASTQLKSRINSKNVLIAGINFENIHLSYIDSFWVEPPLNRFLRGFDTDGQLNLIQSYVQWQHKFSDELTLVSGLHYQTISLNEEHVIEPRAALEYEFSKGKSITLVMVCTAKPNPPSFISGKPLLTV
ncbi:MAG: hypothetical protein HC906_07655 [Bacteroidales bacterium]|nr:hypothetical protein [Bacteroidales bacterium]